MQVTYRKIRKGNRKAKQREQTTSTKMADLNPNI